jgi:hypothetical protein
MGSVRKKEGVNVKKNVRLKAKGRKKEWWFFGLTQST